MIDEFCAEIRRQAGSGMLEEALQAVVSFVRVLRENPATAGQIYESADLDAACRDLGEKVAAGLAAAGPADDLPDDAQVYVCSGENSAGGHGRVLLDFISAQPQRRHLVLFTDLYDRADRDGIAFQFAGRPASLEWAPRGPLVAKTRWLAERLRQLSGLRTFLFHHHEDAVATVACEAVRPPRLHFYHHADHHLALGLHLPCEAHVDLTAFSFYHCRDHVGLKNAVFLPLTTDRIEARSPSLFTAGPDTADFVTCAAGSEGKFSAPYDFPYFPMIVRRLAAAAGTHVHIGPLSSERLEGIADSLRSGGVAPERFRHVPSVPSLSAAMTEFHVSLYLGSWPLGGARGLLEALASGTPVLGHVSYEHEYVSCHGLLPPGAPVWRHPEEFVRLISSLTASDLQRWSGQNRHHWESCHREELLQQALAGRSLPTAVPPPPAPYEPDRLRSWLARNPQAGVLAQSQELAAARRKIRFLEEKLGKNHQTLQQVRERLARVRAERDEVKRGLGAKFRRWLRRN